MALKIEAIIARVAEYLSEEIGAKLMLPTLDINPAQILRSDAGKMLAEAIHA